MAYSYTCSFCGKEVPAYLYANQSGLARKMRQEGLCYDCAYWKNYAEYPQPNTLIIDGGLYRYLKKPVQRGVISGSVGKAICLLELETRELWVLRDYIYRGPIPEAYRCILPDQYRTIPLKLYNNILGYKNTRCNRKGCFDRYHCIWYDPAKSEPNGPWNRIPESYIVGSENCPSFINIKDIYANN